MGTQRDHTFRVEDGDDQPDKPHAVVMTNADGSHSFAWNLSDGELVALYDAIRGGRLHRARFREEVASGRIREVSNVGSGSVD